MQRKILATVTALLLASCGGGGGGSSSSSGSGLLPANTPTPSSGATPGTTTLSDCTNSSAVLAAHRKTLAASPTTFTLSSNPSGLAVNVNGASKGTTPTSIQPAGSVSATSVSIGQSYTVCVTQADFPAAQIFYNQQADTSGKLATVTTSSTAQRTLASISPLAKISDTFAGPRHALRKADGGMSPNVLAVKYRSTAIASSGRSILSVERSVGVQSAYTIGSQAGETLTRIVHVPSGTDPEALRSTLAADPTVASVSRVHMRRTLSAQYPNDKEFAVDQNHQWDLYEIGAPDAWGITEGSPSIQIAIIDTGYDANQNDLAGKVKFSESVQNGVRATGAAATQDVDGHGTNVSGIAAADTNNSLSVAGTGYNIALQEYRIFSNDASSSGATTADEAEAIDDAVSNGAKVISLSLGATEDEGIDQTEYDAVEAAINAGVTVVAASGNERAQGVTNVDFPAGYQGVIAVGASALNDTANPNNRTAATEYVASYSNDGPSLALVAPGGDPVNTNDTDFLHWILNLDTTTPSDPSNQCSNTQNCLALFAGTSQATPHVSATAALMLSLNSSLKPAQIRSILMSTADNINDAHQGAGRLNMFRALSSVAGLPAPKPPAVTNFVAFAYTNSGGTTPNIVDLTFPQGVQLTTSGGFRVADVPTSAGSYKIGVWYDANGNGIVDAGDWFGASGACTPTSPCASAASLTASPVQSGFTLP